MIQKTKQRIWRLVRKKFNKDRIRESLSQFESVIAALGPGDICYDLGAHQGHYTIKMAETGATVYAYEPNPETFVMLEAQTTSYSNVFLHNQACGVTQAKMKLYEPNKEHYSTPEKASYGFSLLGEGKKMNQNKYLEVQVVNLPEILDRHERIKLIKMDIEGGELSLLPGLIRGKIAKKIDFIFVETHENKFPHHFDQYMSLRKMVKQTDSPKINLDWL